MALYEVMRLSDTVRRLVAQRAGEDVVRGLASEARLITLGEDDLAKVKRASRWQKNCCGSSSGSARCGRGVRAVAARS
jgi:hypothetical protein